MDTVVFSKEQKLEEEEGTYFTSCRKVDEAGIVERVLVLEEAGAVVTGDPKVRSKRSVARRREGEPHELLDAVRQADSGRGLRRRRGGRRRLLHQEQQIQMIPVLPTEDSITRVGGV